MRDGYGCIDFLPVDLPDGETEESSQEKKIMLKSLYRNENWNIAVVSQLMASTYIAQWQDLVGVEPMSVTDVKTEWPFLLEAHWFVQHLTRLLGFNIMKRWMQV